MAGWWVLSAVLVSYWVHAAEAGPTVYVSPAAVSNGDGSSGSPYNTVNAATQSAADSTLVVILAGTISENILLNSASRISITSASGFSTWKVGGTALRISGSANVSLSGIHFVDGSGTNGGAIEVTGGSTLALDRCQVIFSSHLLFFCRVQRDYREICIESCTHTQPQRET